MASQTWFTCNNLWPLNWNCTFNKCLFCSTLILKTLYNFLKFFKCVQNRFALLWYYSCILSKLSGTWWLVGVLSYCYIKWEENQIERRHQIQLRQILKNYTHIIYFIYKNLHKQLLLLRFSNKVRPLMLFYLQALLTLNPFDFNTRFLFCLLDSH